ncbi:MAG: hypothetical protein J7K40_05555 [candidate division Zixibacteria bacterium]|nr:hypothetical protein [candidate division Zixibacteria bacterium]
MIRLYTHIFILAIILTAAGTTEKAKTFTDFETIAIASPMVAQIYTNPKLSKFEDVRLSPDNQIKLYENLSDNICQNLIKRFEGQVDFLCYKDIKNRLRDADNWNEFNRCFNGQSHAPLEICSTYSEKLKADGVMNLYLMFSYYKNDDHTNHLDVHFEWYLLDLETGQSAFSDKYDCHDDFPELSDDIDREYKCFDGISQYFNEF